jgi:NitT/TauT family transport system substrate-binding protein
VKFRQRSTRSIIAVAVMVTLALAATACGGSDDEQSSDTTAADGSSTTIGTATADEVRLGFFPNVTHAPALVGVEEGFFEGKLGDTKLTTSTFNAGPEVIEAIFADALDISYIGPNPAINAFAQSNGEAIRIVSGSTSGGAFLVTKPEITSAEDLKGEKVATPQLGNTQDVALRTWLKDEGLSTDTSGGGDVSIVPQANADTLTAFQNGDIAGAWVPEPWATRLIKEGGGKVLVDEATLWPEGKYVTTHLIVRTPFLEQYPGTVKAILEGHLEALEFIQSDPEQAQKDTNAQIEALTDKPLPEDVLADSWKNLTFTYDPIASSLKKSAEDAQEVGLLDPVDLKGIYDLSILNALLEESGQSKVEGL